MSGGVSQQLTREVVAEPLDPELSKRVGAALSKLDVVSDVFKQSRIDERNAQLTKMWMDVNLIIAEQVRLIGIHLMDTHQISLESGTEGGGQGATPWCEEGNGVFDRLEFRLVDGKIDAVCNEQIVAQGKVSQDIPYAWTQKVIAKWILLQVKAKAS